ncbi:MAG: outer membrane protein assembly factor BamE [Burkholderiales bacterium]
MSPRCFVLVTLLVAGCKYMPALPVLTPYKMDVQQGNVVTQEMMARMQPGMTRSQVRFTLGTPLVVDPFRADRWDYVYLYMKQGVVTEQRRIVVVFKDDKLAHIEGDVVPAGAGAARTDKPAPLAGGTQPEQKPVR